GLEALTRVLAAELRPRGIAVNCVAPGPVLKPERLAPARWRAITRGRAARPADVVAAVVHFATCAPSVPGRVRDVRGRRPGAAAPVAGRADAGLHCRPCMVAASGGERLG